MSKTAQAMIVQRTRQITKFNIALGQAAFNFLLLLFFQNWLDGQADMLNIQYSQINCTEPSVSIMNESVL